MSRSKVPFESQVQLLLMLAVGSIAACASWSHVVDLASRHGQRGWLALADAAVLETLAVAMGLDIRRRRRGHQSIAFATVVLVATVVLQLAAQVAQAPRSFWGWTMAALPAIGFLLLVKVAISRGGADEYAGSADPAVVEPGRQYWPSAPAQAEPVEARETPSISFDRPVGAGDASPAIKPGLLTAGREVAQELAGRQVPLTRASMARALRARGVAVGTARAGELVAALRTEPSVIPPGTTLSQIDAGGH